MSEKCKSALNLIESDRIFDNVTVKCMGGAGLYRPMVRLSH